MSAAHRIFGLALVGAWVVALGAGLTANVSWTLPTTYADGTALAPADIASQTIEWRTTLTAPPTGHYTVTGPATTAVVPLACGTFYFDVYVTTTATATYPNASSAPGTDATPYATGVQCTPNPPQGVAVK